MTLGQKIQQIRNSASLSQEAFGEILGTTRQTVSKWELDQAIPEIAKIVMISKLFFVTTDYILVEDVSTFQLPNKEQDCGVYRSSMSEIVETEKFALVYSCTNGKAKLKTELYVEDKGQKKLFAICEHDVETRKTTYAYRAGSQNITNDSRLLDRLDEIYDTQRKKSMKRTESFGINHGKSVLPTVSEAGIKKCLMLWRMADSIVVTPEWFQIFLCTGRTEYIFSIRPQDTDIYCGASYNVPFELGMFGAGQFFRIRNYRDNSEPFCRFYCDFTYEPKEIKIMPVIEQCRLGECVNTDQGMAWCVKRYTDEEIVLQGCGSDEYIYRRKDRKDEAFIPY